MGRMLPGRLKDDRTSAQALERVRDKTFGSIFVHFEQNGAQYRGLPPAGKRTEGTWLTLFECTGL